MRYVNTKTGMEYEALGEIMLNKATATEVRDGTRLIILKSPTGAIMARPKSEFKSGRFLEVKTDRKPTGAKPKDKP